jgi:REP element-mobilizing transposase RayT
MLWILYRCTFHAPGSREVATVPSKPRSDVFDPDEVGVYHCWNRLVQRRHLFGFDQLTGRDYSYRKSWVRDRLRQLAGGMAIEVLDYAVLGNHLHLVLRNRPDLVSSWSDEEVARRWWLVCPLRRNKDGTIPDPKPCELGLLRQKVDEYRARLSDISWFMRLACQPIARRANREDEVDGRFFAQRFDCRRLKTLADLLSCSIYVDLNVIRAGLAETPETSEFTSAYDRICARWQMAQTELGTSGALPSAEAADAWLAPVFLDERAEAFPAPPAAPSEAVSAGPRALPAPAATGCNPIRSPRISNKGFLPLTRDQYLSLLDLVGRIVRQGKRGWIPPELPPILQRLRLEPRRWLASLLDLFDSGPLAVRPASSFG